MPKDYVLQSENHPNYGQVKDWFERVTAQGFSVSTSGYDESGKRTSSYWKVLKFGVFQFSTTTLYFIKMIAVGL